MKNLLKITAVAILFSSCLKVKAQDENGRAKKTKEIHISIITEENGKKMVIDTVFKGENMETVNAFLESKGVKKLQPPPNPPSPPAAPLAPGSPAPPMPPMPPDPNDEDISIQLLDDGMDFEFDNSIEAMELAKEAMQMSLEKTNLSKKEIKKAIAEMEKSLREMERAKGNQKRMIIRKTGSTGSSDDQNLAYSYSYSTKDLNSDDGTKIICITKKDVGSSIDNKTMVICKELKGDKSEHSSDMNTKTITEVRRSSNSDAEKISHDINPDNFQIFPNPSKGIFTLKFNLASKGDTEITIVDAHGKMVFSELLLNFTGDYQKNIELAERSEGIYILNVKQGANSIQKKVVLD